ncbi:MAG: OmpA family protein, partial [Cyclobacteriaceae bacterium]
CTCFLLVYTLKVCAQDDRQSAKDYLEIGDEIYFNQRALEEAKNYYVQAAELDPGNVKANYMAGKVHLETTDKDRATRYFLKVVELDPNYRFDILYLVGQGYQLGLNFDQAINYYQQYREKVSTDTDYVGADRIPVDAVERRIYECENGKEFTAYPEGYSIVNVGTQINSEWHDFAPVLNEDQSTIIFTTRRKLGNLSEDVHTDNFSYEDIFIAQYQDTAWSQAANIGTTINTPFHDSNIALSADGRQLYLYKDIEDGTSDIYYSELGADSVWSRPQPVSGDVNSDFTEKSLSMSPDGGTLVFSSDRPGGEGEMDIYLSTRGADGVWSDATNLGAPINSEYDEDSPFLDYDGKTLYFSSRGGKGMGGYDIFKSEYDSTSGKWSDPINLGYPMNTPDDDIYFVGTKDGKRGYFASVRDEGMGYTDIYMVSVPLNDINQAERLGPSNYLNKDSGSSEEGMQPISLIVEVADYDDGTPLEANLQISRISDNVVYSVRNIGLGVYQVDIVNPIQDDFMLSMEREGYLFKNIKITLPASSDEGQEVRRKFELNKLEVGLSSILRNIYFDFDKFTLKATSFTELNKLDKLMSESPKMRVELAGHTDFIGTREYNMRLSVKRANSVVTYLINRGINPDRLEAVGYGKDHPLASNDDEVDGRELNRRVEFKILER